MQTRRGLLEVRQAAPLIFAEDGLEKAVRRIYKAIESKHLPDDLFLRVGGRIFFRASRLQRWLHGDGEVGE